MSFWRPTSPLAGLTRVKAGRSKRESSWDRTGGNRDFAVVPPGETHVLADIIDASGMPIATGGTIRVTRAAMMKTRPLGVL